MLLLGVASLVDTCWLILDVALVGLGADLDNPELLAKQAKAARAKAYAKTAQQRTALLRAPVGRRARSANNPKRNSHTAPSCGGRPDTSMSDWGRPVDSIQRAQEQRNRVRTLY